VEFSPLINRLIEDLRCLPGVGPKTAQRMAFHLLEHDREGANRLAATLIEAVEKIGRCGLCRTLSETKTCSICQDPRRDRTRLCIVETPADVHAIEHVTGYRGLYFVLMGHLSPIDGVGPNEIGVNQLKVRFKECTFEEVILATNPTVEGEATAHYLAEQVRAHGMRPTRIAHGVPLGGELEYIDGGTLSHAFNGRLDIE